MNLETESKSGIFDIITMLPPFWATLAAIFLEIFADRPRSARRHVSPRHRFLV